MNILYLKKTTFTKRWLSLIVVSFLSSCVTMREYTDLHKRVDAMNTQIVALGGSSQKLTSTYSKKIAISVNSQEKLTLELAKIHGEIDALKQGVRTGQMPGIQRDSSPSVSDRLSLIEAKIKNIEESQNIKSISTPEVGKANRPMSFSDVEKAFHSSSWPTVVQGFESDLASASLSLVERRKKAFYLAQGYYHLKKFDQAAIQYSEYLTISPRGAFVSQSKLHLGDCFRELGDKKTARIYYNELAKSGSSSTYVEQAKKRLSQM